MNFTEIFNGMVGKDFIVAFNDNFRKSDQVFLEILATLIYKVKSTDIKEFKVIDGVVSYTMEEEPAEGEEDNRSWTPVDITAWGNINGNLEDQLDLKEALDSKAALITVNEMNNILSTLRQEFNNLRDNYEDTEIIVTTNQNDIADLKEVDRTKVNSPNIKGIRVSDAEFQWTVDGITWNSMQTTTSISWGNLTGDINMQDDLMALFRDISDNVTALSGTVSDLTNQVAAAIASLDDMQENIDGLSQDFSDLSSDVNSKINTLTGNVRDLQQKDIELEGNFTSHTEDTNNPHQVTKAQLGLENVNNTADIDKPISNPQKAYVDEAVAAGFDTSSLVKIKGDAENLFVGEEVVYNNMPSSDKVSTLAFVLYNDWRAQTIQTLHIINHSQDCINTGRLTLENKSNGKYDRNRYYCDFDASGAGDINLIPEGDYNVDLLVLIDRATLGLSNSGTNIIIGNLYNRVDLDESDATGLDIITKLKESVQEYLDVLMIWVANGISITSVVKSDEEARTLSPADPSIDPSGTLISGVPMEDFSYALYVDNNESTSEYVNGVALGDYVITYTEGGTSKSKTVTVNEDNIWDPIVIEEGEE